MSSNKQIKQYWFDVYNILKSKIGPDCSSKVLYYFTNNIKIPINSFSRRNAIEFSKIDIKTIYNIIDFNLYDKVDKSMISKIYPLAVFLFSSEYLYLIINNFKGKKYHIELCEREFYKIYIHINFKTWINILSDYRRKILNV